SFTLLLSISCLCRCFDAHVTLRDLPAFPTRRSSDLSPLSGSAATVKMRSAQMMGEACPPPGSSVRQRTFSVRLQWIGTAVSRLRSEEHTSELQSHLNLVCRLLLEKKKKKSQTKNPVR